MPPRVKESSWHFWCVFYKERILNKPGRLTQDPLIPAYIFVKETETKPLKSPARKQVWVNPSPWKKKKKPPQTKFRDVHSVSFCKKPLSSGQGESAPAKRGCGSPAPAAAWHSRLNAVPSQVCRALWMPRVTPHLPSAPNRLPACHLAEEAMGSWEQHKVWQPSIPHPWGSSLTGELAKMNRYLWSGLTEINSPVPLPCFFVTECFFT